MNALQNKDPGGLMKITYIYGAILAIYYFLPFKLLLIYEKNFSVSWLLTASFESSTEKP